MLYNNYFLIVALKTLILIYYDAAYKLARKYNKIIL